MKLQTGGDGWNPYLAGALLGLLAVASALATTQLLGQTTSFDASTTFVRAARLLEKWAAAGSVSVRDFFGLAGMKIDWQVMLTAGICFGAFLSSITDRTFCFELVPPAWRKRFGSSIIKRAGGAFFGGAIAMIGARLANGSPSDLSLGGMMQLSISALAALAVFLLIGTLVATFVYNK